jgi:hypothetical protein
VKERSARHVATHVGLKYICDGCHKWFCLNGEKRHEGRCKGIRPDSNYYFRKKMKNVAEKENLFKGELGRFVKNNTRHPEIAENIRCTKCERHMDEGETVREHIRKVHHEFTIKDDSDKLLFTIPNVPSNFTQHSYLNKITDILGITEICLKCKSEMPYKSRYQHKYMCDGTGMQRK